MADASAASTPTPSSPASSSGTSSGTATPSPASSSSPTSSATPSSPSPTVSDSPADVDFSMIFGDGEATPTAPETTTLDPKAPATAATPEAKPAVAEPAKPEVAVPVAPPAPAPTEPTSATVQPSQLDPYDPGALATALQTNEAAAIAHLAEGVFKLSPEEIEALEADVVGSVPKLLAKTFVRAQVNMFQQLSRLVPQMMMKQTKVLEKHAEAEGQFYTRWPDIKKDAHGAMVMQYASVFRQMHPEATRDQVIEAVGPMVMMAGRITPSLPGATPQAQAAALSPMASVGRPQPVAFTPAAPNGGGATPQTFVEEHPAATMFQVHDQ